MFCDLIDNDGTVNLILDNQKSRSTIGDATQKLQHAVKVALHNRGSHSSTTFPAEHGFEKATTALNADRLGNRLKSKPTPRTRVKSASSLASLPDVKWVSGSFASGESLQDCLRAHSDDFHHFFPPSRHHMMAIEEESEFLGEWMSASDSSFDDYLSTSFDRMLTECSSTTTSATRNVSRPVRRGSLT